MVPRENKNNAYPKFWRTNKEYYGIFESGLYCLYHERGKFFDLIYFDLLSIPKEHSTCPELKKPDTYYYSFDFELRLI